MTRILIADDHEVVRSGLRSILETHLGWEVVAEAADGNEAIGKALQTKPDVAVVDYALPVINGIGVTSQIRRRLPGTEVLVFTMHDREEIAEGALRAGARGFLSKSDARAYLIEAIEAVAAHTPFFTSKVSETLLRRFIDKPNRSRSRLTPRERDIVQLIAEGHTNKEIARILGVSRKTVETHRAALMRKLNLRSSAALVRYAVRTKLVEA